MLLHAAKRRRLRGKHRRRRRRRRRLHTDEVVFTDKYELPMYPEVRWKYADASDASLTKWKADHFEQHVTASKSRIRRSKSTRRSTV